MRPPVAGTAAHVPTRAYAWRLGLAAALVLGLPASGAFGQEPTRPDTTRVSRPPAPLPEEQAGRPTGPEVTSVEFPGAKTLDTDILRNAIETKATECKSPFFLLFCALGLSFSLDKHYLDPAVLSADVERLELLYETWGFPEATVTAVLAPKGDDRVEVEFRIREGEPIRVAALDVRGLYSLEPPVELPRPLPLEVGGPYALPLLDSTQTVIRRAFAERGHPYAQIEVGGTVDEAARTARVVLDVSAGPRVVFGETTIVAEAPIQEKVVRERLQYEPGDSFSLSAIEETQRQLYELPIVKRVEIEPVGLESGATVIEPRVTVESRRTQAVQVEGTVSSTECLELALFWRSRYFLGGPRLFSLGVGASNLLAKQLSGFPCTGVDTEAGSAFTNPNYFVQADLRQPWPGSPRTAIQLNGFVVRETAPRVYVRRGYGGEIGIAHEFEPALTGAVRYAPSRNELTGANFFFCATYGVCSPTGIDRLTRFTWLAPIEVFTIWTPEGPPTEVHVPVAGERWRRWLRAGTEGAAPFTGSQYDYIRLLPEGAATRILGERGELAMHSRTGFLAGKNVLPPQVRLYSGGPNTVRGVPQNLLGPKYLTTSPAHARSLDCTVEPNGCPAGLIVDPNLVSVRPTGGKLLFEANLEARYWVTDTVQVAAFADLGVLSRDPGGHDDSLVSTNWSALVTPGIGIRVLSGLGPIRIDLAYDPSGSVTVPLLVREPETGDIIVLGQVVYRPFTWDDPGFFTEQWRRLQLQVAIGQPF